MRIGFVGAGRIGRPMVRRLVGSGHRVRVAHRSEAVRAALAELGAEPVADPGAVAEDAEVVGLCLYTDQQVRDVTVEGGLLEVMPAGSALVIHTTGSPMTIADLVGRAEGRDVEVVDAPISGGAPDIEAGHVTLYVGATAHGLDRARPALSAYAEPILHLGPPGTGQLVKLVNNAVFAANIGVLAQALQVADKLGLTESAVLTGLEHGSGGSRALLAVVAAGSAATFGRSVGEFVGKDVAVVRDVVAELGADLGVLEQAYRVLGELLSPSHRAQLMGSAPGPELDRVHRVSRVPPTRGTSAKPPDIPLDR